MRWPGIIYIYLLHWSWGIQRWTDWGWSRLCLARWRWRGEHKLDSMDPGVHLPNHWIDYIYRSWISLDPRWGNIPACWWWWVHLGHQLGSCTLIYWFVVNIVGSRRTNLCREECWHNPIHQPPSEQGRYSNPVEGWVVLQSGTMSSYHHYLQSGQRGRLLESWSGWMVGIGTRTLNHTSSM